LILRKIRGFDATRCQIFKAKMHKIRFPLGICPRPRWGTYSAPPDPVAVFKGPTCKGREGEERPRYFGLELPLIFKPYAGHYAICVQAAVRRASALLASQKPVLVRKTRGKKKE